jgi:cullin 1
MAVVNPSYKFPELPPAAADLATTWAFLEEGIDRIMGNNFSYTELMSLYGVCYNYCTSSKPHRTSSSERPEAERGLSLLNSRLHHADI